jgi:2-C-methyl-D-erythritol 2,4-cyclodiphosphate synthase
VDIRFGNGFDVHRLIEGKALILGGVRIPANRSLEGHSDADVGLHSLTDAILGALALGDIGTHFPPSNPHWKNADSSIFLIHARDLAQEKAYKITNADLTFICEYPKISKHRDLIRQNISTLLNIDLDRVSVKATTTEQLGFTGREEGIACLSTIGLIKL